MCGILGTSPASEEGLFNEALSTLTHRGPDDFGIWNSNDISLGHRRLSILDLSDSGKQPMSSADGRYQIVFNGEIYNFVELRLQLNSRGHDFVSRTDTEVLLAAYREWGEQCVLQLNGMWAFAIWDTESKNLFLSRDRFGKKPLFYAFVGEKFVFASEMKAIFPFLDCIRPSEDFQWMINNVFSYEATEKCLIEGIHRFPHGCSGNYKNGKLDTYRYWNTLDHLVEPARSYDAQVEEFRELFIDACRVRMRADVPIGTALSGGLDSSATIAAMSHISSQGLTETVSDDWQHAFVAAFPNTPLDETYYAKLVTDHLDIDATFIDINPLEHWDRLEEYFYLFEEIYITSPIPMLATYGAVKKNGVSATIDGHGADELFSGYGHLVEALWDSRFNFRQCIDILDTYQQNINDTGQLKHPSKLTIYLHYIAKQVARSLLRRKTKSIDSNHENFRKLDNFSQHLYVIFHESILPTLLRNYDRYSMMNSVEIRMPFMDHRIVSYVNSLPHTSKFGDGYTKKLIRDAVAPFLPHKVTYRKSKIGFNTPIVDWMQGPLKEWFEDTVSNSDFLGCDLIENSVSVKNDVLRITKGHDNSWDLATNAWTKLTPYLWEKAVIKRQA